MYKNEKGVCWSESSHTNIYWYKSPEGDFSLILHYKLQTFYFAHGEPWLICLCPQDTGLDAALLELNYLLCSIKALLTFDTFYFIFPDAVYVTWRAGSLSGLMMMMIHKQN